MLTAVGPDEVAVAIFIGALASFVSFGLLMFDLASRRGSRLQRRLAHAAGRAAAPKDGHDPRGALRRDVGGRRLRRLEGLLRRGLPGRVRLRARLARTGLPITLAPYLLCCFACGLLSALMVRLALGLPLGMAVAVGGACGVSIPHVAVGLIIARRQARFLQMLPEALDVIVRGLRTGLPVIESVAVVGKDFEDPIRREFAAVADAVRLGMPIEEAVRDTAARLRVPEFDFFSIAVAIQRETGGNLAETIQNLSTLLRARQQMKLKIRALSAEARASAMIIGALPALMLGLMQLVNAEYVSLFFTDIRGYVMLGIAAGLEIVGALVMAKMVRFRI